MDEHDASRAVQEGPFRRSYALPILLGPWACSVVGVVILGFGMVVNSPAQVRITELVLGAGMVVAGTLMPRMRGPLELGATGFKGQVDTIPAALALARRAAENAIPEGQPDRDKRAREAVDQAVRTLLILDGVDETDRADEWVREIQRHLRRTQQPPDQPPPPKPS